MIAAPEDPLKFLQAVGASGAVATHPTPIEQFLGTHPAAATLVKTRMKLLLQLPEAGDSTTDATAVWPDTRKTVLLGTITLKRVLPDSDAQQRVLAFSPLNLVDGIQPSADPLIVARAAAYGVSFGRRQASLTTTTDGAR